MRTIIIYATKYGSVAHAVKLLKPQMDGEVVTVNIMEETVPDLVDFDTVILGGSIYMGKIQKKLANYVEKHLSQLLTKKVGLFICAAQELEIREKELFEAFPFELYQHAVCKEVFGYEFHFEKMNFIEKKIVRVVMGTKENCSELSEELIGEFAKTIADA